MADPSDEQRKRIADRFVWHEGDVTVTAPPTKPEQEIEVIGWDGSSRYLIAFPDKATPMDMGVIVDLRSGKVQDPPAKIGTITAMTHGGWLTTHGPDEGHALKLARANVIDTLRPHIPEGSPSALGNAAASPRTDEKLERDRTNIARIETRYYTVTHGIGDKPTLLFRDKFPGIPERYKHGGTWIEDRRLFKYLYNGEIKNEISEAEAGPVIEILEERRAEREAVWTARRAALSSSWRRY